MGGSFGLGRVEDVDREERAWCKVLMLSGLLVIGSDSLDWTTKGGEEVEVFVFDGSGRKE